MLELVPEENGFQEMRSDEVLKFEMFIRDRGPIGEEESRFGIESSR
nr:hypothetical protein [Rickettsiales endosymbiont of Peranema trichophorum]